MLLCGIFYGSNKPLMNMFLRPIVEDLLLLFREGKLHSVHNIVHLYIVVYNQLFSPLSLLAPRDCC